MLSEWLASKSNSPNWTGGYEIGSVIVYGPDVSGEETRTEKPHRDPFGRKNLIRLGIEQEQAYQWSCSRMGGCPPAGGQSQILDTTITVERLKKRGYVPLLELYNQAKPVK